MISRFGKILISMGCSIAKKINTIEDKYDRR